MNDKLTLIQLISDQSLQNVLPIIALKPGRVVSVLSSETARFTRVVENIQSAVQLELGNLAPQFEQPVIIGKESPYISDSRSEVLDLLKSSAETVVNYTGGTKEMSIGAWQAAAEAGIGAFYCDSPREFRSESNPVVEFPMTLRELLKLLSLETILAAHGLLQGKDWTQTQSVDNLQELGRLTFNLATTNRKVWDDLRKTVRNHGLPANRNKANKEDVERALAQPIPIAPNELTRDVLQAAVATRILEQDGQEYFFRLPRNTQPKVQAAILAQAVNRFDGFAFEGYLQSCLPKSARFSKFLQGIEPVNSFDADFGETDFVAFDPATASLVLISCKAKPPSMEHLESVLARKERLGGRFARALLCVQSAQGRDRKSLGDRCNRLGIELAIGKDIAAALRCPDGGEGVGFDETPEAAALHQNQPAERRALRQPYNNVTSHPPSPDKFVTNPASGGAHTRTIATGDPAHGLLKGTVQDAVFMEDRSKAGRGSLVFQVVANSVACKGLLPVTQAHGLGPLNPGDKLRLKVVGSDGLHLQLRIP